ncbi:MAG: HypC/HybG/HupF family hydrogenase formation chaperone [Candidatus Brocadiaceae bacterium]|nr:HypC/HybG/HupF family hydrogenase formation chaperone [Candidatus Brocadiaceae bacterium]
MKLIKINGVTGIAELGNLQREIGLLLLENANVGDYVIVHAGYAIQKLDEKEAFKTISLLESYIEKPPDT